jgi:sugar lactone lactonase YvrE
MIFDSRTCELGEGPLWHPKRGQLFWFDILNKKLLTLADGAVQEWQCDEMCCGKRERKVSVRG